MWGKDPHRAGKQGRVYAHRHAYHGHRRIARPAQGQGSHPATRRSQQRGAELCRRHKRPDGLHPDRQHVVNSLLAAGCLPGQDERLRRIARRGRKAENGRRNSRPRQGHQPEHRQRLPLLRPWQHTRRKQGLPAGHRRLRQGHQPRPETRRGIL